MRRLFNELAQIIIFVKNIKNNKNNKINYAKYTLVNDTPVIMHIKIDDY